MPLGIRRLFGSRVGLVAVTVGALATGSTGIALAIGTVHREPLSAGGSAAHVPSIGALANTASSYGESLGVLTNPTLSSAGSATVHPGAVLADERSGNKVYIWQQEAGEPVGGPYSPDAREDGICMGLVSKYAEAGGSGCGGIAEIENNGGIEFTRVNIPGAGQLSPWIVTALVPNGVTSVKLFDADGDSHDVPVVNNVVVAEDGNLVEPPGVAVKYTLPDGRMQQSTLPPGGEEPQQSNPLGEALARRAREEAR